jgi:diadenosine tetraphosphate (Ap4A) HIT family hydrolase
MNWSDCIFCKKTFPLERLLVSDKPKHWYLVHNLRPVCDFHCLLVLKNHDQDISSENLSPEVLHELGILLNKACLAIKKCSNDIKTVTVSSLNSWENSKHLHFHLIPIFKDEQVKRVNKPLDGGGFFYLWRKEITDDTFDEYIETTCWEYSWKILHSIQEAIERRTSQNTELLREYFHI